MKKTKVVVVMNEQHTLLDEQKRLLDEHFKSYEFLHSPANGWTVKEMDEKIKELNSADIVVFVSPIPYMVKRLSYNEGYNAAYEPPFPPHPHAPRVLIFHNDRREKKELPDGRVIQVIAQTGWRLI